MCSQGKTKQWLCLGTVASEREARHGEGSHTQKKIEEERDGERDGERMRVGEWGSGERERTLPWRFILPLCNHQWHSPPDPLLSQTNKRARIPV